MRDYDLDIKLEGWLEQECYWGRRLDLAYHRRCILELGVADARELGRDRRIDELTPMLAQARSEEVRARFYLALANAAIDNLRVELRSGYRGWDKDRELQRRRGLAA